MMLAVLQEANDNGVERVLIAASQHSGPFFAKFGAEQLDFIKDGWGDGMHKLDMILNIT